MIMRKVERKEESILRGVTIEGDGENEERKKNKMRFERGRGRNARRK